MRCSVNHKPHPQDYSYGIRFLRIRQGEQWCHLLCVNRSSSSRLFQGYDFPSSVPCGAVSNLQGRDPSFPAEAGSGSSVFPAVWLLPCKTGTWGHNPYKLFLSCCTHGRRPGGTCDIYDIFTCNTRSLRRSPSVLTSSAVFSKTFSYTIKTCSLSSL